MIESQKGGGSMLTLIYCVTILPFVLIIDLGIWVCKFIFSIFASIFLLPFKLAGMLIQSLWNAATHR